MWRYSSSTQFVATRYTRRILVMCFVLLFFVYIAHPVGNTYITDDITDTLTLQLTKAQIGKLLARTSLTNISVVETKRSDTSTVDSDGFNEDDDVVYAIKTSRSTDKGDSTLHIKDQVGDLGKSKPNHKQSPKSQTHSTWPAILPPSNARLLRQLDYSKYTPEERSFLLSRIPVYEERARIAGAACASHSDVIQQEAKKTNMVWDTKHTPNIVWCPNYKVASTTMMINFLRLGHFNEHNPDILRLPEDQREAARFHPSYGAKHPKVFEIFPTPKSEKEKYKVFTNALRAILVRHPFTRILSAYRDKMTKMDPRPRKFKFRDIQIQIIKKYRAKDANVTLQYPTFAEFSQYLIDSTRNRKSIQDWKGVPCWQPYWVQCSSCNSDHNVIMKLETFTEDERFLVTISDLQELKEQKKSEWRHLMNSTSSQDAAPDFYRQLTRRQITNLYQSYKLDFQIYGYSIKDYLAIAKDA